MAPTEENKRCLLALVKSRENTKQKWCLSVPQSLENIRTGLTPQADTLRLANEVLTCNACSFQMDPSALGPAVSESRPEPVRRNFCSVLTALWVLLMRAPLVFKARRYGCSLLRCRSSMWACLMQGLNIFAPQKLHVWGLPPMVGHCNGVKFMERWCLSLCYHFDVALLSFANVKQLSCQFSEETYSCGFGMSMVDGRSGSSYVTTLNCLLI